ncbi:MAG: AzlD domain-containing protein, partial [Actinomycetota bacterium]
DQGGQQGGGQEQRQPLDPGRQASLATLLAALVAGSTFVADRAWTIDARLAGLVAAALALWLRLPFVVVVVVAAAATAATRALG